MGIPSIPGDFPFSNWEIAVFSSAKVICCVSLLLSSFFILAFRGFNSFLVFGHLFVFWCKGGRKLFYSNLIFENH